MDKLYKIEGEKIHGQGRRLLGTLDVSSFLVRDSIFENCVFGLNRSPFGMKRDSVTDGEFIDCKVSKCLVGAAIVRRTKIHNLSGDLLICRGALFDRVALSGTISPLMLHGIPSSDCNDVQRQAHGALRATFYENVEYALDISNAEFSDFSIRTGAIPLSLVRRDKRTQFLVSNVEKILSRESIGHLSVSRYTKMILNIMFDEHQYETLLVAPKLDMPLFEEVMRDSEILAEEGLLVTD